MPLAARFMLRDARLPLRAMNIDSHGDVRRLMVVDDDHDLVDALCEWIELSSDWTVTRAYGPAEAIAQAGHIAPDAILLDMEMDGFDGFDTADRLGVATASKHPALLALTGNARLCEAASRDARFSAAMLKPTDLAGLLRLLEKVSPIH